MIDLRCFNKGRRNGFECSDDTRERMSWSAYNRWQTQRRFHRNISPKHLTEEEKEIMRVNEKKILDIFRRMRR